MDREQDRARCKAYYWKNRDRELARRKAWKDEHPEYSRQLVRRRHREQREQVLEMYGGKCACCGESQYEFLAIDHTLGNGKEDRRRFKNQANRLATWLLMEKRLDYRILCHNCNMAIGLYGKCPHGLTGVSKSGAPITGRVEARLEMESLLTRIAAQLPLIGWRRAKVIAERFKSVREMVEAGVKDWMELDGIGKRTAEKVVNAIWGVK